MATPSPSLTGTRIRERRLDRGMRQADLAEIVGISPSYLNLIEHNRRRIAGRLLGNIARALEVDAVTLTEGADREILEKMQAAAAHAKGAVELDRVEEFAERYPGWAGMVVDQAKQIHLLGGQVQELSDRLSHDPALSASLHAVISSVTSIRSTASILTSSEDLDSDWQRRFHKNIYEDAIKLAGDSDALIGYLEAPQDTSVGILPAQEVEDWLELNVDDVRNLEINAKSPGNLIKSAAMSDAARSLLERHLDQTLADADQLPEASFAKAAIQHNYDPGILSEKFAVPFPAILRRLSSLSPEKGHPSMGLTVCDGAGAILFQKSTPEFGLPRAGNACPRWPLFASLSQPMRPLMREVSMPGTPETRFMCYAFAEEEGASLNEPPKVRATMLAISDQSPGPIEPLAVGPTCRICIREGCQARREPSVLGKTN